MLPPIYTTLNTLEVVNIISRRVYRHGSAPQDTTKPYVTWQLITGTPENNLSSTPSIDRCTVQIDCWHQTDTGIEQLAIAVRDAVEPYAHITGFPVNEREPETKLYRIAIQLDWWLARADAFAAGDPYYVLGLSGEEGNLLLSGDSAGSQIKV